MSRIRLVVGCVGLFLVSSAWAELRTYDVDFKYQQEVYQALNNILAIDPGLAAAAGLTYGRVQLLPTGQIVVDTSAATHAEIEKLLEAIRARQTVATPRVTFRYWVVLGTRVGQSPDATPAASAPPALAPVLEELERVHGDLTFRVVGTATLATESGQMGQVSSTPLRAKQTVYVQGDSATAGIELAYLDGVSPEEIHSGGITLNVTVERGEYLVLGESTVRNVRLDGTVFYIVHWPQNG